MFLLIYDLISYLNLERHEQFFTVFFLFLCLLLAVIFIALANKYFRNDSSSIYSFYKSNSENLSIETNKISKMLKDLNEMTNELNKLIVYTNASIEARKEIIETLQLKIDSLSAEENNLNDKMNTLNLINDRSMAINNIMNDFFQRNNKNSVRLNVLIGFIFCILGFALSKVFS